MKPIAIQLYTLRERAAEDFPAVLRDVAAMGYRGVETAGLHGMAAGEVRKILDDLGLECCSMHSKLPDADELGEIVDTASALGCEFVISGCGKGEFVSTEAILQAAEQYQAAGEKLAAHGLKLAYHNHWWEMDDFDGRMGLELLLEKAPSLLSELDIYWACNFGAVDVPALLRRQAARTPLLHVKDGPLVQGQPHTPAGAGKMDIPAVIAAADESVLEWVIVELDECATDMTEAVGQSCKYLVGEGLAEGR